MTPSRLFARLCPTFLLLVLAACQTDQQAIVLSERSAVELRAMQSRQFETSDTKKVYRAVIATFQDLGYSITKVEPAAGTVSADKLASLEMTVAVFPRGDSRVIVRSNAIVRFPVEASTGNQVDLPEFYQQRFFEPLGKALFLTALQVQDPPDEVEKKVLKAAADKEKALKAKAEKEKAEKDKAEKSAASEEESAASP